MASIAAIDAWPVPDSTESVTDAFAPPPGQEIADSRACASARAMKSGSDSEGTPSVASAGDDATTLSM